MNRRNILFAVFTVIGVIADQVTKAWIVANVDLGFGEIPVIPHFLSIVHAQNPGAAFGLLGSFAYRHYLFLVFTLIAGGVIFDLFRKLPPSDWFMSSALGLILSGAIGNAIDRVRQQYVTDFIRVYTDSPSLVETLAGFGIGSEWPSFNIADAALVVGVGMFIVHHLVVGEVPAPTDTVPAPAPPPSPDEEEDEDDIPTEGRTPEPRDGTT